MAPSLQSAATKEQLTALSQFRYALRRFLRFSEDAANAAGITSLQYQLLVHVAGMPGREWATVGELAELLQAKPHGAVALVTRCEEAGLVRRKPGRTDRRQVEVHLLPKGRHYLNRLAVLHLEQWQVLADAVDAAARDLPGAPATADAAVRPRLADRGTAPRSAAPQARSAIRAARGPGAS